MAEKKQQEEQAAQAEAPRATPELPSESGARASNPVDLGTNVDDLPPVPGAGQFMAPEEATEPAGEQPQQQKRG